MKTVYLVRHGETVSNREQTSQPFEDPLTDTGRAQAARVAARVANLSFDNFFASDMPRAHDTALAIAEATGKEVVLEPLFRELRRPSSLSNPPISRDSEEYITFHREHAANISNPHWRHSDEENFFDMLERVKKASDLLHDTHGDTLVVAHGHVIRFLVFHLVFGEFLTPELWRNHQYSFVTSNTGITALRYDEKREKWYLLTFNDFAHFAE